MKGNKKTILILVAASLSLLLCSVLGGERHVIVPGSPESCVTSGQATPATPTSQDDFLRPCLSAPTGVSFNSENNAGSGTASFGRKIDGRRPVPRLKCGGCSYIKCGRIEGDSSFSNFADIILRHPYGLDSQPGRVFVLRKLRL